MFKIKSIFKTEYFLILIALFAFALSLVTRSSGNKNFASLENRISNLQLSYICIGGGESKIISSELQEDFLPFTYYNSEIANSLSKLIQLLQLEQKSDREKDVFISESINFQMLMNRKFEQLNFGYECLIFSSFVLIFLAVFVILYKNILQRNELLKIKTLNDAHLKFSRDLHDGASQDLAALRLYLEQNDSEKSRLYAEQAFKEIRYLIDSLHLDLSENFNTVISQMLESFEANYKIKTQLLNASTKIDRLNKNIHLELYRILQEAMSNTARHAGASLFTIKIIDSPDAVHFTISDNGTGFNAEYLEHNQNKNGEQKHYGLLNIKERVSSFGGTVDFIMEGGTVIAITIRNSLR